MQRPNFCLEKQTNSIKNQAHGAITSDNLENFKRLSENFQIEPHEELSVKGYFWSCLHYAAHFKAVRILDYLIVKLYRDHLNNFEQIMNTPTKEGWTPVMIAGIYNSVKALELLLKYGGMNLLFKDKDGNTVIDLTKKYSAKECENAVNEHLKIYPNGIIPLKKDVLEKNKIILEALPFPEKETEQKEKVLDDKTKQMYKALLFSGIRIPCSICLSNMGYLQYTKCCGQPLHKPCVETLNKCPICLLGGLKLSPEILYPERAFMPDNADGFL